MARLSHQAELEGYILDGMARALWVHAYMIWATEVEPPPTMGSSWAEMATDNAGTRKASGQAAQALAELLTAQFGGGHHPLAEAFLRATHRARGGTEADRAYVYGENLALVCLGALAPADSVPPLGADFAAPSFKVELDDDGRELSWEGGADEPTPNPARRLPTVQEIAQAVSYIEREFKPDRRGISGERWAEGLAFGEHASVDTPHELQAKHMLPQFDTATWLDIAARADELRAQEGEPPRFSGAPSRGRVNPCTPNPAKSYVLVLEDDGLVQRAVVRWVKKLFGAGNVEVLVADNVDDAIAHLSAHDIKLIVSDVDVLGDKNGVDLFRYVQASQPDLVDRYIFFTGGHPEVAQIHYRYLPKGDSTFDDFKAVYRAPAPGARGARTSAAPPPGPLALAEFAAAVQDAVARVREESGPSGPRGRFGAEKVYIGALWRALASDPRFAGMTLSQFKARLVAANREQLLDLVRADSQGDMDPQELADSEIQDMGATFHFVIDRNAHRRNPDNSNSAAHKVYNALRAAKSRDRAAWLAAAAQLRSAAASPYESDDSRQALIDRAESAEMNAARSPAANPASESFDLKRFASDVGAELPYLVAERTPDGLARGRYGDRKVFIAALWRQLSTHPRYRDMTFDQFKQHLMDAVPLKLLKLARADLVAAMDTEEVRASETVRPGTTIPTYHFVIDE